MAIGSSSWFDGDKGDGGPHGWSGSLFFFFFVATESGYNGFRVFFVLCGYGERM